MFSFLKNKLKQNIFFLPFQKPPNKEIKEYRKKMRSLPILFPKPSKEGLLYYITHWPKTKYSKERMDYYKKHFSNFPGQKACKTLVTKIDEDNYRLNLPAIPKVNWEYGFDFTHYLCAVKILNLCGKKIANRKEFLEHIYSWQKPEGYFKGIICSSLLSDTHDAILLLKELNAEIPKKDKLLKLLQDTEQEDGSILYFVPKKARADTKECSWLEIAAETTESFYLLGGKFKNPDKIKEFIYWFAKPKYNNLFTSGDYKIKKPTNCWRVVSQTPDALKTLYYLDNLNKQEKEKIVNAINKCYIKKYYFIDPEAVNEELKSYKKYPQSGSFLSSIESFHYLKDLPSDLITQAFDITIDNWNLKHGGFGGNDDQNRKIFNPDPQSTLIDLQILQNINKLDIIK